MSAAPPIAAWPAAPLQGKVVLITGGANGIRRGIAQAVLGAGGPVLNRDLDAEAGQACLDERQLGDDAPFHLLDASAPAHVPAVALPTVA